VRSLSAPGQRPLLGSGAAPDFIFHTADAGLPQLRADASRPASASSCNALRCRVYRPPPTPGASSSPVLQPDLFPTRLTLLQTAPTRTLHKVFLTKSKRCGLKGPKEQGKSFRLLSAKERGKRTGEVSNWTSSNVAWQSPAGCFLRPPLPSLPRTHRPHQQAQASSEPSLGRIHLRNEESKAKARPEQRARSKRIAADPQLSSLLQHTRDPSLLEAPGSGHPPHHQHPPSPQQRKLDALPKAQRLPAAPSPATLPARAAPAERGPSPLRPQSRGHATG